jgi:hypothetical protein
MTNLSKYSDYLEYKDGGLYWKVDRGSQKCKGKKAGTLVTSGYLRVRIRELGKSFLVHRVIFFMHHGYFPEFVDHINCDKLDNRIENLRAATKSQNLMNKEKHKNNTTGFKNVYWMKKNKKWAVMLSANKKKKYFGSYDDLELAELVAIEAREKYHGVFANHGAKLCQF